LGEFALGVLETRGIAALTAAGDAMLKAASVEVCGRHGIGAGWVTLVVTGRVSDVQVAIREGVGAAQSLGEVISSEVIPRPEDGAMRALPHDASPAGAPVGPGALGLLEVRGLAPLIAGADAVANAADVSLAGWASIGGALTHLAIRGEVAAVEASISSGRSAAEAVGEVNATLVLPRPSDGLGALLPPAPGGEAQSVGALGVLETTGYVGSVAGCDAMVKAASVDIHRLSLGSGGRVASLAVGSLDSVQAAMEAGAESAGDAGELEHAEVVSRPEPQVLECFGGEQAHAAPAGVGKAMGLLETRSTVALVRAMDEMLKSAEVELEGSCKVGYFLTASVIRGDVAAVQSALSVGVETAQQYGESAWSHVIPYPLPELEDRLMHNQGTVG